MKKILLCSVFFLVMGFGVNSLAAKNNKMLNSIVLELQSKVWNETSSAQVLIKVNATLSHQSLTEAKQQIMKNLTQIAAVKWHVVNYTRNQDASGLQRLQLQAQARLSEQQLASLQQRVDAVSKSGQKFSIANINFQPSLKALQATYQQLRDKIYVQAQQEVQRINKIYTSAHYFVHQISFVPNAAPIVRPHMMNFAVKAAVPASLPVGREVTLRATVILSSIIDK